MSLGARGQLGKDVVLTPHKGLRVARQYVVPDDPQTPGQVTQRSYMADAVAEFHAVVYTTLDIDAWNRLAALSSKSMTGFNRMCRAYMDEARQSNTWERIHAVLFNPPEFANVPVFVTKATGGNAPTLRWGTSKTWMPNSAVMIDIGGDSWINDVVTTIPSTVYYFTIDVGATGVDLGRVGLYYFRSIATL